MNRVPPRGTVPPISGLRHVYSLLPKLCTPGNLEPEIRVMGMRFAWVRNRLGGRRAVSIQMDDPAAVATAHLQDDGAVIWAKSRLPAMVIDLRNLAANPERRLRRFGFDTRTCPFCSAFLGYETLDSGLGHCLPCGELLRWPLDQVTADCAEDDLREDIMREIEEEDRER